MSQHASDLAFTPTVKAIQAEKGRGWQTTVTPELTAFLAALDMFYLGTANAEGQPYIQYRGGAPGFLKVIDEKMLGFADFGGNRQYITMELRPTVAQLQKPIQTFQTLLGAAVGGIFSAQNPVTIQLPEIKLRVAESTVRMPDRGSILLGGLKDIDIQDQKSQTPILGDIPILGFLLKRQGKSEEVEHLMIIITATITDLSEEAESLRGS